MTFFFLFTIIIMTLLVSFLAFVESAPAEWEPLSFQVIKPKKEILRKVQHVLVPNCKRNQRHTDEGRTSGSNFVLDLCS